jgi:hypothetical protein
MNNRPTPAVLHACAESRNEFLYRRDENANNGRRDHPLYRQAFPNIEGQMIFFSFETDSVYLYELRKSFFSSFISHLTLLIHPCFLAKQTRIKQ